MRNNPFKKENGVALIITILLLLVLTLIGISSLNTSSYDSAISGNKRSSEQAFYIAEAGLNEFKGRFKKGVAGEITDGLPTDPDWSLFIAVNQSRAEGIGYDSSNPKHVFVQSLQSQLDFGVEVRHRVDSNMKVVIYGWKPVYIAKSYGFAMDGGRKAIEAEIKKGLDLDPPAALYSQAPISVKSDSTEIVGTDKCGTVLKDGIVTTQDILITGHPTISTQVEDSTITLDLETLIESLKEYATYSYDFNSNTTLSDYNWGTPILDPPSYTGNLNVVYFNMHKNNELTLSGTTSGAGLLLVEGDLSLQGSFTWYGVVVVTGSLRSTGGSTTINIIGAVLAGNSDDENVVTDLDIFGNTDIFYCSTAIALANDFVPFKIFRWREIF